MYRAVRWSDGRSAARLCLHQGASEGLHRRAGGRSGGFPRLHRLGAARLLQGRRRRPPQRRSAALHARLRRARRLLPRLRVRLDAHPRRLGPPHLVSGCAAGRDGLDAGEVHPGRRVDAGRARRCRAARGNHGRRARHGLDRRRGGDLGRCRRDRVRRLASLDGSGRCADRPDRPLRRRRGRAAASAGVLPARVAGAAKARSWDAAAAARLDDGVPARLLLRDVGDRRRSRSGCCCARSARTRQSRPSSSSAARPRSAQSSRCSRCSLRPASARARPRCTGSCWPLRPRGRRSARRC